MSAANPNRIKAAVASALPVMRRLTQKRRTIVGSYFHEALFRRFTITILLLLSLLMAAFFSLSFRSTKNNKILIFIRSKSPMRLDKLEKIDHVFPRNNKTVTTFQNNFLIEYVDAGYKRKRLLIRQKVSYAYSVFFFFSLFFPSLPVVIFFSTIIIYFSLFLHLLYPPYKHVSLNRKIYSRNQVVCLRPGGLASSLAGPKRPTLSVRVLRNTEQSDLSEYFNFSILPISLREKAI